MFDFSKQYLQFACQMEAIATNQKVGQQGCRLTDETRIKEDCLRHSLMIVKLIATSALKTTEATVVPTFAVF